MIQYAECLFAGSVDDNQKKVSNVTAHGVGCFNRAVEPLRFLPS